MIETTAAMLFRRRDVRKQWRRMRFVIGVQSERDDIVVHGTRCALAGIEVTEEGVWHATDGRTACICRVGDVLPAGMYVVRVVPDDCDSDDSLVIVVPYERDTPFAPMDEVRQTNLVGVTRQYHRHCERPIRIFQMTGLAIDDNELGPIDLYRGGQPLHVYANTEGVGCPSVEFRLNPDDPDDVTLVTLGGPVKEADDA